MRVLSMSLSVILFQLIHQDVNLGTQCLWMGDGKLYLSFNLKEQGFSPFIQMN